MERSDNLDAALFKRMTDQSVEVYFIFDLLENRIQYINPAFEEITKKKCTQLFEDPGLILAMIHEEDIDYVNKSLKNLTIKETNSLLEFRICRPDGIERWIRLKVYPILENGNITHLTGTAEDDTARKTGIFNMQKVNGWKDANLEILSHDLRGPIGTVKMLASVIDRKLPHNPELHKLTKMIEDISVRNIELIQTLLTREFLATEEVEISKERLDVVWEINQAIDIYLKSQENIEKCINFKHAQDHVFANVDSMKFLQIINNLVSNAIKFTGENGEINVYLEQLDSTFLITVEDNGIGIPKNLWPSLFNKYTEAGREGIDGEKSTGLGMWIVKRLAEEHGGHVWFESEVNKGSKFYVEIPLGEMME